MKAQFRLVFILAIFLLSALPVHAASLFDGEEAAKAVQAFLTEKGSDIKALDVTVYPERILIKAQDPAKPENVDQYTLTPGFEISAPVPVRLIGPGNPGQKAFAISDVKFDSISRLVREAITKTNLEGGQVTHVLIQRNLPFSNDVHIRVFVSGTRKFAFVDNDINGKFKKVTLI